MSGDDRPQSSDDMLREVQDWLTDQDADLPSEPAVEESPAGDRGPDSVGAMGPDPDALVTELHIGDRVIDRPTVAQIMEELADLANAEFAVLVRTDLTYMQAAIDRFHSRPLRRKGKRRSEDETYQLEYQDGSLEEHYEVADGPVPFDRVVEAFRSYAAEDGAWKTGFSWSRLHL